MKRARGFTLIELMVVVIVIAVLATMALSAYGKQVRKSRRAEAKQTLSELSLRQEKWRANHVKYFGTDSSPANITAFGALPTSTYYNIAVTTAENATNYTITATPKTGNDQAKDICGTMSMVQTSSGLNKTPTTGGCW